MSYFLSPEKKRYFPNDNIQYIIGLDVIKYTEHVLQEYGEKNHEGFVYWGGTIIGNSRTINSVIAPKTNSWDLRITTSHHANYQFVKTLRSLNLTHLAQVHTHPGKWVDHSYGDDQYASFKVDGLLSIIISNYCQTGFLPLEQTGIHRYGSDGFIRLSAKYIESHFTVDPSIECSQVDLR